MSAEHGQRYDLFFAGECLEGFDPGDVRAALAKLFAADDATVARLFSGKLQRIKRNCDAQTARSYRDAMQRAGARVYVRRTSEAASTSAATEATGGSDRTPEAGAALSLAPPGSDVLTAAERVVPAAIEPATDHLSLAEPHDRLSQSVTSMATAAQAPDFEVAPVGSRLGAASTAATPEQPDTTGLTLVEGRLDLSDCAPPPTPPPEFELDELQLLDPGAVPQDNAASDASRPAAPATQHLALEPIDDKPA